MSDRKVLFDATHDRERTFTRITVSCNKRDRNGICYVVVKTTIEVKGVSPEEIETINLRLPAVDSDDFLTWETVERALHVHKMYEPRC